MHLYFADNVLKGNLSWNHYKTVEWIIIIKIQINQMTNVFLCINQFFQYLELNIEFRKCSDVFYIWIKWKLKEFQITWVSILFTIENR